MIFMFCQVVSPASAGGRRSRRSLRYMGTGRRRGKGRRPAVDSGGAHMVPRSTLKEEFMTITRAARLAVLVAALLRSPAAARASSSKAPPPPPAVTVANPVQRTVVDQDEYVGRFVAVESVEIRSRLSGYLSAIHFTDGQMVKKGDLLFTIDRRPFQIVLEQMRGQSGAGARQSRLHRSRSAARPAIARATRPSPSRPSTSAPRPSASPRPPSPRRRRWCIRPSSISSNTANCVRRSTAASATAACRRRQSGHRRRRRHHDAARHHRLGRSDPFRIHLRRGVVSALRALRHVEPGRRQPATATCRSRSS